MKNWDEYYLLLCEAVSTKSSCLSRQIGVIIVKDKSVISTGYNGPARGVPSCSSRYTDDKDLQLALTKFGKKAHQNDFSFEADGIFDFTTLGQAGTNGFPYKIVDFSRCPRREMGFGSSFGLEYCPAVHAEVNALLNAARRGISVDGATMYMTCGMPCKNCLSSIINAGIREIVLTDISKRYDDLSEYILQHSNLKVRRYGG